MTPGLPREAGNYARPVGRVMNSGDGLFGGIFITSMYAAAFFETDPRQRRRGAACCRCRAEEQYAKPDQRRAALVTPQIPTTGQSAWQLIEKSGTKMTFVLMAHY